MPIRLPPTPISETADIAVSDYANACATLGWAEAFFEIGELYTTLLPSDYRTRHGIYYTPPPLVARLLDLLESRGVDWATARVLDPACGGAAFAAYVAQRMLSATAHLSPEDRLRDLSERLVGFDIDPFAAWLSSVLLDVVCLPVLLSANRRIDSIIRLADTLAIRPDELGLFDVVVGNPPYGKLTLSDEQRARFKRSLFGHANVYGVFTDLAVSLTKPGGLIAFVTPTSFLGGEYFKNLRSLLEAEAPPEYASFVSDRDGVFSDVLQETMLTVYRRRTKRAPKRTALVVESVELNADGAIRLAPLGSLPTRKNSSGAPWILPRTRTQISLVRHLARMPARLADYGFRVSTGQLVWNRHKEQFRDGPGDDHYPVLWAECITSDGNFIFRAESRNHRPYIKLEQGQDFLVNQEPCVLVQRTTSKEQSRRLIAATVPNSFVGEHAGFVIENHVNMVVAHGNSASTPLWLVTRLLNSQIVDQVFRCISGSVAVSAYEMESVPLPDPIHLLKQIRLLRIAPQSPRFDELVNSFYCNAR
jgi:adenine-specific DNA-methyltransferase